MRLALHPLAVAAGLVLWTSQPPAVAEELAPSPKRLATATADTRLGKAEEESWKSLLNDAGLSKEDHATLLRLKDHLAAETYGSLDRNQRTFLLRYARNQFEGKAPLARCWAPGTPENLVLAYHAVEEAAQFEAALQKANQFFRRWSSTVTDGSGQNLQGRPITLTWSIVPDGTPIASDPSIGDSSDPSNLRARLAELYGGDTGAPEDQPWFQLIADVFADITAKTGINYRYERDDDGRALSSFNRGELGRRGDIRLGGHAIDGNGSTLAYTYFPDNGDTVIDTGDSWFADLGNNSIRLANTIAHEHGHGIGLEHVCPVDQSKLLEPFIPTNFRGLQFDEIFTLQRWYGDPFEHHAALRDNDSFPHAKELEIPAGSFLSPWLSIDDNSDIDYFSLMVPGGRDLTVRVVPSTASYLEGPQNSNGSCSGGTTFDPSANHDLTLELIDSAQSTVLASAGANPAGQPEEIVDFTVPSAGRYFIRVTGGDADLAQLYRLEVEVGTPPLDIAVHSQTIVTESFAPSNSTIDPGETVRLEIALVNHGSLPVEDVWATLTGPPAFTGFEVRQSYGTLPPATPVTGGFVFALRGDCGTTVSLDLEIAGAGDRRAAFALSFTLGSRRAHLAESFDSAGGFTLPAGWSENETGHGSGWRLSRARSDSPPYAVFARDEGGDEGVSNLMGPPVTLGGGRGILRFRHYFDLEASPSLPDRGYDGGVLEMSVNGGAWQDILDAGGIFREGGYTHTLYQGFDNPLPNRRAWSGRSNGWITSIVELPAALGGQPLRFRWRLGHDEGNAEEGWYIDNVEISSASCGGTAPAVALAVQEANLAEFTPNTRGLLVFSTELPSLTDLRIPLLNAGTASPARDVNGLDDIVLLAGETSREVSVQALNDGEVEGEETLILSIDPASGLVPAGTPTALLTISDTPYGQWAAAALGLGTANGPLEDRDADGSLNIEEYAWRTDGASSAAFPRLQPHREGEHLRLEAPLGLLPGDLSLRAETSPDLQNWTSRGIEDLPDGFRVMAGESRRFLRLRYELIPAAP